MDVDLVSLQLKIKFWEDRHELVLPYESKQEKRKSTQDSISSAELTNPTQSVPEFSLQPPSSSEPVHKEYVDKSLLRTTKVSIPQETML